MLYIAHRINTVEELRDIPYEWGVEIDLRDSGNEIVLQHDPFITNATNFECWLKHYNHSLIILNIKSEGIEYRVLELLKRYNITSYFFLDSSIPMINKLINKGENNIAIRYSEYEPLEFIDKFRGKCKWLWVDCFTKYPELNNSIMNQYQVCLVSPTLQGRIDERIPLEIKNKVDAICEKSYNIKKMKVAVYCCGYLRGFRTSLIKLKELILDRYDCDLYFYSISNEQESDKYINTKYNIESLIQECKFYILEKNNYDINPLERIKQMWFKIYMCNKFRLETEQKEGFKYDYIIRIRPDCKLECSKEDIDRYFDIASRGNIVIPLSPNCSYPDLELDTIKDNYNDQFALGYSEGMNIYCELYSYLKEYRDMGIKNSSSSLYKHLTDNNISCFLVDCPSTLLLRENIVITIAGDSGTGKTTMSYKLKEYLEIKNKVLLYECDRYHKWSRGDINWKSITHLNPEANRIEQMKDDIIQLKANNSINQVEYDHSTGKFTELQLIKPLSVVIVLGLHTLLDSTLNKLSDCKIYIEPDYDLKTKWKIQRDNIERGYTIEQSLKSIEDRKEDYEAYIKPQKDNADIIINYTKSIVRLIIRQSYVSYLLYYKLKYESKLEGDFFIIEKQSIEECFPLIEQIIFKGNK